MKKQFRVVSLILCLLTAVALLAACGGDNGKTTTKGTSPAVTTAAQAATTAGQNVTTTAAVTTAKAEDGFRRDADGYVLDNIPENIDLESRKFNILAWNDDPCWLFPAQEDSSDIIATEVYNRNLALETRLNCQLVPDLSTPAGPVTSAQFMDKAAKCNEEHVDLIITFSLNPSRLAQREQLYNLNKFQFPQNEMPWYPSSLDEWAQYGTLFFTSNSYSAKNIWAKEVVFADLQAVLEVGLDDPLELVINRQWTLDKMYEYTSAFHDKSIASQQQGGDYHGLVVDHYSRMDAFYYGAGCYATKNNSKGIASLAFVSNSDLTKITTVVDKVLRMIDTEEAKMYDADDLTDFYNRTTAFEVCTMGRIIETKDDYPYAAMPMPLFDETQKEYHTVHNDHYDVMCIPVSASTPEDCGVLIEAFSSSDYRDIAPVFYEDKLKNRYSRSQLGTEIYDLILSSTYLDFGTVSYYSINPSCDTAFRACFQNGKNENIFATKIAEYNQNRALSNRLSELLSVYKKYVK